MLKIKGCIFVTILLLSLLCRGQQPDGSVLENRVTIIQKDQTLSSILDQLSWQAGVFFSYDASVIDAEKKFSIEAADKSLFTILNQLFNPSEFKFSELENQVIISKIINQPEYTEHEPDTIPVKYFFLSGKIIDQRKGDPIVYASISIYNKPIGTITNPDGEFLLKIHPDFIRDTLVISCMGYSQILTPAYHILDDEIIEMTPVSIRIKEVKVTATTPHQLLENFRENIAVNYCTNTKLISAFYRETVKQDNEYINISEAVIEILKSPYVNTFRDDLVRLLKGRRSPDVRRFQWLNFKLQGGPFTITKLDLVKTMESFINEEYENLYRYNISKVVWYNEEPVYVVEFQPVNDKFFPGFIGEMYVHRETFAIVHASFRFNKSGLREAESMMIKKKPAGVSARPSYVSYQVNYQKLQGKWHLANAQASVKIRVRSKRDKLNSEYHSVSDLLITDSKPTELKRFPRNESFTQSDIFVEMIHDYDEKFWENYNIIKPDEDLRNALKTLTGN